MRIATCAPILGLCAATLFSQTHPDCKDTVNRTVTDRWAPTLAPAATAFPQPRPIPECALCTNLSPAASARYTGVNRIPVYRAIRSLGSRVFPGNTGATGARKNTVLAQSYWRGSDFRFTLGDMAAPSAPCAAPLFPVR